MHEIHENCCHCILKKSQYMIFYIFSYSTANRIGRMQVFMLLTKLSKINVTKINLLYISLLKINCIIYKRQNKWQSYTCIFSTSKRYSDIFNLANLLLTKLMYSKNQNDYCFINISQRLKTKIHSQYRKNSVHITRKM